MSEKEMSQKAAIGVAFVVLVAVGFVVPALSDPKFDGWVWFIQTYQTMLGGILAVVAAYITIQQMQLSDLRSDERHEDMLRITMLADQRRADRAVNPLVQVLEGRSASLKNISTDVGLIRENDLIFASKAFSRLDKQLFSLARDLNEPNVQEARIMFSGALDHRMANMKMEVEDLHTRIIKRRNMLKAIDDEQFLQLRTKDDFDWEFLEVRNLWRQLDVLINGFHEFANEFGVKAQRWPKPPEPPK